MAPIHFLFAIAIVGSPFHSSKAFDVIKKLWYPVTGSTQHAIKERFGRTATGSVSGQGWLLIEGAFYSLLSEEQINACQSLYPIKAKENAQKTCFLCIFLARKERFELSRAF